MPFPRVPHTHYRFTLLDPTYVRSEPACARQLADRRTRATKVEARMEDAADELRGGPRGLAGRRLSGATLSSPPFVRN